MLVEELDGLQKSKGLIDRATNGQVVHSGRANDTSGIHDEQATEGDGIVMEDTEALGDGLVQIGNQWETAGRQSTLLAGELGPGQVAVLRVDTDTVDLGTESAELFNAVTESIKFSRANEGASRD